MRFSAIFTALFFPYIAHERTAQNLILSLRSSLFALFLIEHHRSQNAGSLKSEEPLSDFKERCAQLCIPGKQIQVLGKIIYSCYAYPNKKKAIFSEFLLLSISSKCCSE